MAPRIVILGAPGSGKGTQARPVTAHYGIPHISTGAMFRDAVEAGTPLGHQANPYLLAGTLVPDSLTLSMVRERLEQEDCAAGFLLDGFPRSAAQAEALDEALAGMGTALDHVVYIKVGTISLIRRLTSRRVCKSCGTGYNLLFKPPREEHICDACGGAVYQRDDDREETIQHRLEVYMRETEPLAEHYTQCGLLRVVNGEQGIGEITQSILEVVGP